MTELNDDNFLIFAIKNYQNSSCTGMAELEDDLKRFKYLKRLLNRYTNTGEPNERLIINHLILLYNVFVFGVSFHITALYKVLEFVIKFNKLE